MGFFEGFQSNIRYYLPSPRTDHLLSSGDKAFSHVAVKNIKLSFNPRKNYDAIKTIIAPGIY